MILEISINKRSKQTHMDSINKFQSFLNTDPDHILPPELIGVRFGPRVNDTFVNSSLMWILLMMIY